MGDEVGLGHDHGTLDAVAEFADVTRPAVLVQRRAGPGVDPLHLLVVFPGKLFDERCGKQRDVFLPLPQRRHVYVDHVEPVKEILPETPRLNLRPQVSVGGGDDADIHREGVLTPHALELLFLKDAQNLDLHALVDLSDLVQEDRTGVGQLKAPPFASDRPGKRAFLVPKQLALQQRLGECRAVHLHQRFFRSVGETMNRVGDELLAHPTLSGD